MLTLRIALLGALAGSALVSLSAATALASPSHVISDCNSNGRLLGHYSSAELQSALNGMSADIREYTNCYDVIRTALMSSAAAGARPQPVGAAARGAVASLPKRAATAASSTLPTPLTAVLIVVALAAIGSGGLAIGTRVLTRDGT